MKALKNIAFPAIAALCACSVGKPVSAANDALWHYSEGLKKATVWGDFEVAEKYYRQAILADSGFDAAYHSLAMLTGDAELARRAVELDSTNLFYRGTLGRLLVANKEYDEALEVYGDLISLDPHNYLNYRILAALYEYRGLLFLAISTLDSAEIKTGAANDLMHYRILLLTQARQFERAVKDAEQILDDNPNDIDALIVMAENSQRQGDEHSYLTFLQRLFVQSDYPLDRKLAIFEEVTANIEFYRRNYFDINTLAATLFLTYPDSREALDTYAKHLLYTGDIEQAVSVYKLFLDSPNSTIEDYRMVLDIEGYLQHPDSVSKYAVAAIERYPRNAALYASLGVALLKMERPREALDEFQLAVEYSDSDTVRSAMLSLVGDVYHQLGDRKECYATYKRALKLNSDNAMALNNYAYFMCEEPDADLELCLMLSTRAVNLESTNSSYLDTYAWILHLLGRSSEAKQQMMRAISLDSTKSATLYSHYAAILEALGDTFMAEIYRQRAAEADNK